MPRLQYLNRSQVEDKIKQYAQQYVKDWDRWLQVREEDPNSIPREFGKILGRWQACRPNKMRKIRYESDHEPPFLEELIEEASDPLSALCEVEMTSDIVFTSEIKQALLQMWRIFKRLSYEGKTRGGLAGIVGISKAVMLLTEGRIGPAFDSNVKKKLGILNIDDPASWISELKEVARDIELFEQRNGCLLREAAPYDFSALHYGRLYDMVFGPRIKIS